ncbi:hypothetical protein ACLB2K_030133 [Fragaria x ananassa]
MIRVGILAELLGEFAAAFSYLTTGRLSPTASRRVRSFGRIIRSIGRLSSPAVSTDDRNYVSDVVLLGYAVELVKKSKEKMSEEYFRSAIDFVEIRGRPPLAMEGMSDFIVSDTTRTGLGEIDFGLGKPVYAGVAKSIDLISFYVRSTNNEER